MHVMCGENAYSSKYLKKKDSWTLLKL
jgi:hypothetical protein